MINIILSLVVVELSILFWLYNKLSKPKNLSHIPSASLYENLKSSFFPDGFEKKVKKLSGADLKEHKIQARLNLGMWIVLVSSPKAARMIFNDTVTLKKRVPVEELPDALFAKFMGVNLVFSNHQVWKRHRKVLNPPFKKQFNPKIFADCVKAFFNVVENNFGGEKVDIIKYMQRITMDAMGKGIMGVDFNSVSNQESQFINAYNEISRATFNPFYFIFPFLDKAWFPFRSHAYKKLSWMENHFQEILEDKRRKIKVTKDETNSHADDDILTLMLKASNEEEIQFTDKEIRDNIMVFILAGHDTTAFALAASLHFLAQHQDVQDKVRAEVMEIMGLSVPQTGNIEECLYPTNEQAKKMEYMMAVVKETSRLYPSVARLPTRIVTKDTEIDGVFVPAKTQIDLDIYSMQRDPDNWPNPDKFMPERFLNFSGDSESKILDVAAWSPFGGGTRSCIGMNFSILEQKVVLAMILSRYKVEYPESAPQYHGAPLDLAPMDLLYPIGLNLNFTLL